MGFSRKWDTIFCDARSVHHLLSVHCIWIALAFLSDKQVIYSSLYSIPASILFKCLFSKYAYIMIKADGLLVKDNLNQCFVVFLYQQVTYSNGLSQSALTSCTRLRRLNALSCARWLHQWHLCLYRREHRNSCKGTSSCSSSCSKHRYTRGRSCTPVTFTKSCPSTWRAGPYS